MPCPPLPSAACTERSERFPPALKAADPTKINPRSRMQTRHDQYGVRRRAAAVAVTNAAPNSRASRTRPPPPSLKLFPKSRKLPPSTPPLPPAKPQPHSPIAPSARRSPPPPGAATRSAAPPCSTSRPTSAPDASASPDIKCMYRDSLVPGARGKTRAKRRLPAHQFLQRPHARRSNHRTCTSAPPARAIPQASAPRATKARTKPPSPAA